MATSLILPMATHLALCVLLYVALTVARAPSVWGIGQSHDGSNPWMAFEPRISANLSNQFEWPLFFHVVCLVLMQMQSNSANATAWAWIFIVGRVVHSLVQILTNNIRLRGLVFTINFLAVLMMWVLALRDSAWSV